MHSVLFETARVIFDAAIKAVRPEPLIESTFQQHDSLRNAAIRAQRIIIVGGGKAGGPMAVGLESALFPQRNRVSGLVNVPSEALRTTSFISLISARPARANTATQTACDGATKMLAMVNNAGHDDLVICLLSGGGSALLPVPRSGVSLEDKKATSQLLTEAGATIHELNCVRKHLSQIKGGQLASQCCAAELWSLIISDVVDDRLDVIASGPAAADLTTFQDAMEILNSFNLLERVPKTVADYLMAGCSGQIPETPKVMPSNVHNLIIANNETATAAASIEANRLGYSTETLNKIAGQTSVVAVQLAERIRSIKSTSTAPCCLVVGGETTVSLPQTHGLGGRNQELALGIANALGLDGLRNVCILCGSTDGEDGPTDAAGAFVDQELWQRATASGLNAGDYLTRHDCYRYFERSDGLIKTGLTGTNVADVAVILIHGLP